MIRKVNINEILDKENIVYIDVRSPKEYQEDTIPGAINIPILTDSEREEIGFIYKQVSTEEAKELGLQYGSKKLSEFYRVTKEINEQGKDIAFFCYRGGMRSNSIVSVLNTMGLNVFLIEGGYKSYRKYVIKNLYALENKFKFVVLHGYTGVGKTTILKLLKDRNEPVLDLEYVAKNSGSVFGELTYQEQSNNQKNFESLLLNTLKNIDQKYLFVESESKRIGKVIIPDFLFKNMEEGYHILIETSLENRISNILDDYINTPIADRDVKIINSIDKLRKNLGNSKVNELIQKIENKEYEYVIKEIMIKYYDPLYDYSINKIKHYEKTLSYKEINESIDNLIYFASKYCI